MRTTPAWLHAAAMLRAASWLVEIEVTYSEFGERGSFDLLAFHPASRVLLVVEVKTELASAEATLRKLDEKARLARKVASERFGWHAAWVTRLLVFSDQSTTRRRVARHDALFAEAVPMRNVVVRRWLRAPDRARGGLLFMSASDPCRGIRVRGGRRAGQDPQIVVSDWRSPYLTGIDVDASV